jgi:hypothetical protein
MRRTTMGVDRSSDSCSELVLMQVNSSQLAADAAFPFVDEWSHLIATSEAEKITEKNGD